MKFYLIHEGRIFGAEESHSVALLHELAQSFRLDGYEVVPEEKVLSKLYDWTQDYVEMGAINRIAKIRLPQATEEYLNKLAKEAKVLHPKLFHQVKHIFHTAKNEGHECSLVDAKKAAERA